MLYSLAVKSPSLWPNGYGRYGQFFDPMRVRQNVFIDAYGSWVVSSAPLFSREDSTVRISFEFEAGSPLPALKEFRHRCEAAYLKCAIERFPTRETAAHALGLSRQGLWERLRALGLTDLLAKPSTARADVLRRVASEFNVAA
jgi:hypothetical protein